MSCHDSGGTLTLPSPTHVRHVDVTSGFHALRRSLSRSPSKLNLVTKSPPLSTAKSTSPLSPSLPRAQSQPTSLATTPTAQHAVSPLAVPFPPSAKLALRSSARGKSVPLRATRTSPRSPMRRGLGIASDHGNAIAHAVANIAAKGKENGCRSPLEAKDPDRFKRATASMDGVPAISLTIPRLGIDGTTDLAVASTSSPLKRSDAIMDLDQASLGSPVAKRRSLHGASAFGGDFNVFDHGPSSTASFEIHDDANHEYELASAPSVPDSPYTQLSVMPRRSCSLRKSTLQQRHGEKSSWGRRHAAQVLSQQHAGSGIEMSTPQPSKTRPRLSLDQFLPPMTRESPFSAQGGLPNASMHVLPQVPHHPHPLSRTMTTSSSSSSLVDDSPTHLPPHFGEQARPKLDFSKSLPPGALRAFPLEPTSQQGNSFATPKNFRSVKPLPAAFMSTGLVSKVNRNPEEPPKRLGLSKGAMPDTPCKKQFSVFNTYPAQSPGSAVAKARHIRHSFGTPSTPFNPHGTQAPGTFGKGATVFGSMGNGLSRRGSFVSLDGEELSGSPLARNDSQNSGEYEFPPTPTKSGPFSHPAPQVPFNKSPIAHRVIPAPASIVGRRLVRTSKLSFLANAQPSGVGAEATNTGTEVVVSPPKALDWVPIVKATSFGSWRATRDSGFRFPSPLPPLSLFHSVSPSRSGLAKMNHPNSASPLDRVELLGRTSPHTPHENMPDPSGLSISKTQNRGVSTFGLGANLRAPATPTAMRDYFGTAVNRRLSGTPSGHYAAAPVDESLVSRFDKAELIGTGEFSTVYRVVMSRGPALASTPQGRSPSTPLPDMVFAVKKSRQPFHGTSDRARKLKEVQVLKALGTSDHVVHFHDSWEAKNHLYIQTEYCEEGSLDLFLAKVGRKGRLDDFRIWKIMLELGLGLQHIHDSGFIHLDLKPANILVTFEGVLRIADFGMATAWPAQPGIEGEGDREYIGPEILLGRYDKPSDIFALGLIMLEIAGNVQLPDNGPTWQRLRSGDMSDVPSLTWSSVTISRDASGDPLDDGTNISVHSIDSDDEMTAEYDSPSLAKRHRHATAPKSATHDARNLFGDLRGGELAVAPSFMRDMYHPHALDNLVRWMIKPSPEDRPLIQQVVDSDGVRWVQERRRAGATVFEGNWGPADAILADDAVMLDV